MDASLFPGFWDFDPSESRCIGHIKTGQRRRCLNSVAQTCPQAHQVRDEILRTKRCDIVKIDAKLENYARLCCCTRWHRNGVSSCIHHLVQRWKNDLAVDYFANNMKYEKNMDISVLWQQQSIKLEQSSNEYISTTNQWQLSATASFTAPIQPQYNVKPDVLQISLPSIKALTEPKSATFHNFIPYRTTLKYDAFRAKFMQPLSPNSLMSGNLYLYTRACDPGFVNIGCTLNIVLQRMAQRQKHCHYIPIIQHSIAAVPNVQRAERLIHLAIAEYRRRETTCKTNSLCSESHLGWLEIDIKTAKDVMNKVAHFMQTENPYGSGTTLTKLWTTYAMKFKGELTLEDLVTHSRALTARAIEYIDPSKALIRLEDDDRSDSDDDDNSSDGDNDYDQGKEEDDDTQDYTATIESINQVIKHNPNKPAVQANPVKTEPSTDMNTDTQALMKQLYDLIEQTKSILAAQISMGGQNPSSLSRSTAVEVMG